jgi:hypothetical protein
VTDSRLATGIAVACLLLAACATTPKTRDSFSASWVSDEGRESPVRFRWESRGDDLGTLHTKLGRESFTGYYARIREAGAPIITSVYNGWGDAVYASHDWGAGWNGFEPVSYASFVRVYASRVLASLEGSSGRAIRCNLEPTRPERGALAGARGRCQVSDGGSIDVAF